ncbi:MAG: DUF4007 family protein [Candidatus Delongbacteria bacterium]|nr:DUF4007 family protein [Candidatus Delongbacteria bacterium]
MEHNLRFSGHETFVCKQFWLKKGFDYAVQDKSFNVPEAVSELGVGKNMVTAINFWLKSFGIIDDSLRATKLGEFLFGDDARDEYLEDIGSIWLLHYYLISKGKASIYNLVFNDFIRERNEFTKEQLHNYLKRKCFDIAGNLYNEGTITKDINTFIRNYVKPKKETGKLEIEEDYSALLLDLEIISSRKVDGVETFRFEIGERKNVPSEVVLFVILDNYTDSSISFNSLLIDNNSPGRVFCLNQEGLYNKIIQITQKYKGITFTRTAGNEVLQISAKLKKWEVISGYYN